MENNYCVTYFLSNDSESLITLTYTAIPFLDEKGRYTLEESKEVVKFIDNYKVPNFNNKSNIWEEFTNKLNKEIFNLYGK